jgi:hypothetical protein
MEAKIRANSALTAKSQLIIKHNAGQRKKSILWNKRNNNNHKTNKSKTMTGIQTSRKQFTLSTRQKTNNWFP